MRNHFLKLLAAVLFVSACGGPSQRTDNSNSVTTPKPAASQTQIKNGDYPGKGKITKINKELGSVEMDHEEIVGVMPAMRMEFNVSDKKLIDGLKAGDDVDFTLRYKDRTEIITGISKARK